MLIATMMEFKKNVDDGYHSYRKKIPPPFDTIENV